MPTVEKPYRKLGRATNFAKYSHLFVANDHLMVVDSTNFNEEYKRFFFRDIQALILTKTAVGKIWNTVWGTLAFVFVAISLIAQSPGVVVLAVGCIVGLIINTLIGPTCSLHLRTAVQFEKIDALSRLKKATKVVSLIKEKIQETQGVMPSEELHARIYGLPIPPRQTEPTLTQTDTTTQSPLS